MNNYAFFRYNPGESKIHKMNSKYKIICLLLSILVSILTIDYISLGIFLLFLVYLCISSKISIKIYINNLFLIWPLYLLIFILSNLITFNIYIAFLLAIKFMCFVILMLILTFTTSLSEIAWGFECLFIKLKKIKVPVSKISLKIAMMIKFISTFVEQYRQIRKSMAYRGVSLGTSKIKTFRKMFIPVINLSYKLSKRTLTAMKLRFYGTSKKRTNYHDNKVTSYDKVLVVVNIVLIYISISLGWIR